MSLRVDLVECMLDPAVDSDDVGNAPRVRGAIVVARPVGESERARGIAKQRVGEVELRCKSGVLLDAVERNPEDGCILSLELG